MNIQADESILDENGKYSLEKLNPIIYDEEHWRYLSVGVKAADAFKAVNWLILIVAGLWVGMALSVRRCRT